MEEIYYGVVSNNYYNPLNLKLPFRNTNNDNTNKLTSYILQHMNYTSNSSAMLSKVSIFSLLFVVAVGVAAIIASKLLLPSSASKKLRFIFIWFAFDALIHFIFEGTFIYNSTFGRTVFSGSGWSAEMWKEYAKADIRWGFSDPTIVSLELLTVFGCGPLAVYILYLIVSGNEPARHFWTIVISTSELYGGWMTFCPEWITNSKYLVTNYWLYHYVYLWLMNGIWVIIPVWLLYDSFQEIKKSFQVSNSRRNQ